MCPRSVANVWYMQADKEENADEDKSNINFEDYGKKPFEKDESILKFTEL